MRYCNSNATLIFLCISCRTIYLWSQNIFLFRLAPLHSIQLTFLREFFWDLWTGKSRWGQIWHIKGHIFLVFFFTIRFFKSIRTVAIDGLFEERQWRNLHAHPKIRIPLHYHSSRCSRDRITVFFPSKSNDKSAHENCVKSIQNYKSSLIKTTVTYKGTIRLSWYFNSYRLKVCSL